MSLGHLGPFSQTKEYLSLRRKQHWEEVAGEPATPTPDPGLAAELNQKEQEHIAEMRMNLKKSKWFRTWLSARPSLTKSPVRMGDDFPHLVWCLSPRIGSKISIELNAYPAFASFRSESYRSRAIF